MLDDIRPDGLPLGLLELDAAGKVLYFNPARVEGARPHEVVGRNFFTDLAPDLQHKECRCRFAAFMRAGGLTERFSFSVLNAHGASVQVQFILVALGESAFDAHERLALVRIRPEHAPVCSDMRRPEVPA